MKGDNIRAQLRRAVDRARAAHVEAIQRAADEVQRRLKADGDRSIRTGGNFGARWTNAYFVDAQRHDRGARLTAGFRGEMWFARIFEFGGTIRPRLPSLQRTSPMLWIPLSHTGVKIRARDYARQYGGLFRVERIGKAPLLMSIATRQPIYFGIKSVTLRQRFFIRDAGRKIMLDFPAIFSRAYGSGRRGRR